MARRLPLLIGLTGSIGMGKTETARLFRRAGIPVHDADAVVRGLYGPGGAAVAAIGAAFPGTVTDGAVDRDVLRARVADEPAALERLNALVHPLVAADRDAFIARARSEGADILVLDVPLLFETGMDADMDAVVVASAKPDTQRARVLARPGMTGDWLDAILARQMPDAEKRAKAHFVVVTDHGLDHAFEQVRMIIAALRDRLAAQETEK